MFEIPPEPVPGRPLEARWGAIVVRALRALHPRASADVMPKVTPGGTSYQLARQRNAGGTAPDPRPLSVEDASDSDGPKVRIRYGTLGGEPIEGMSPGDDPPFVFPLDTETGVIYAIVTVDDSGSITSVTADTGDNVPGDDNTTAYLEIGSFSYDADSKTLSLAGNLTGSQEYTRCQVPFSDPVRYTHQFGVI